MAISGTRLRLTYAGRTVSAVVLMGSDNRKSLLVRYEGIVDGCVGAMAILTDDAGVTRNLITDHVVEIKWEELMVVVVCKTAREPLRPGYSTGFSCLICSEPLQVGPPGVEAIKGGGGRPLCTTCGLKLMNQLPTERIAGVGFTEDMLRKVDAAIEKAKKAVNN